MAKKFVYANRFNLSGLYAKTPMKCYSPSKKECNCYLDECKCNYWYRGGNFDCVGNPGTYDNKDSITFVSYSKEEVQAWSDGIRAVIKMISRLA